MRKVLLSAATLFMSMLFGVSAYAADIDKTDKVGTSKEAWNAAGGPVNIDGISMPEKYETTTATLGDVMWQTVEGLDNGTYTVELWANARYTAGRGFESAATDGQLECTFLFANNVEISIPVVFNPDLNNNTSHVLEGVEVTDGTLKMGMTKKADGSNWHTIQIKSLTLHASDDAALASAKADLQAAIDAAAAVSPATEALTAAIAAAQGVLETATTPEEVLAAVAPLQAATTLAVNTNAVAGATVAAPVVTNFVVNGTFDSATAPWKCTTGAQNQALASNQTGAFTGNFFENWNPSNYTGKIYQVVENIPNGLYELSICAFASVFDGTAQYVYANADKTYLVAGAPTAYTVRTTVTDNKIEVGLEQTAAVNNWMGIDNVSLKYFGEVSGDYALELYKSTKAAAEALLGEKMAPEAKAALEAALAAEVDETSEEALIAAEAALQEAITAANVSINLYASNKAAIDAMFALMNSTNVYTAEAFAAYSAKAEDFLAQYEAGTLTATVDNPAAVHGWHASVDYDDLLLSAFGVKDFDTDLYINTWSIEGETDGSEFKVPFFEYWTGDDQSLGATTKTATVTGLEAGKKYEVSAWVRTRAKNGVAAVDATGITLSVGAGDSVDVTEGAVVGGSQFAHAVYTAVGAADENGNLTINFNVLADNNVSWLSFKNIKYADYNPAKEEFMAAAMALASLTETMPSIWSIPAVSEKFMAVQEKAFGMVDTLDLVPVDTLVYYTGLMNETAAFAQAMDAEFNEWKALLFTCYDYQDNSTADEAAVAAFAAVVDVHMGYQYSMPATTVAELEALTAELDDARIAYALVATANDGFDFGLPTVDSPWVGAAVADGMSAYLYNASAKAFLGAGNSWGTQASFNDGIEWVVAGAEKLYTFSGTVSNGGEQHYFTGTYTDGAATQVTVKPVGKGIYTLQVGGAYVAYDGTNIVANVAEVSEACYWQFVTKEERQSKYAAASVLNPASATFEISGANFGRNDGANSAWTGSPKIAGENDNMNGEKWNAGIVEVSQILRGMPNGVYRLSAQGFYRMGGVAAAAEARANGTEELHGKFFANGDTIPVMSVMEEAGKVDGVGADYGTFGKAPNSQGEASKFFNAGLYEHSFMFTLAEGVDTIKLGATKTGSVGDDWLLFDNFRLEYLGAKNDVDYLGNGTLTSVPEGNHYVFYTDAEGGNHFLYAAGDNNWTVLDKPVTVEFSAGNIAEDPYAGAASFMNSNGYYMSNAQNSDGSGAIKTEAVGGSNGQKKRTWESQVFYKNAAGKYAIRLTNAKGTSWGANCFVNIDPATLAVGSGQPTLGDALYLWEIADEDDPRFSTEALAALINEAEALQGKCSKAAAEALAAAIAVAKEATAAQVQEAKAALEAAIADFKASVVEYSVIAELINRANAMLNEEATECYDDLAEVAELAEIFYNDGVVEETTATDLQTAMNEYVAALDATYSVEGLVNGTFGDVTASIDGWTQVGGASKTGSHNKWLNVNDGFFEQWQNTLPDVEIYQEISGLPAGTYTFAAYVVACQQSNLDSYEVSGVSLYANDDAVAVHTINIDRNATNQALGAEFVMVTTTIAEGETLKVGMKVASTDANWVVMDNAKLYNFNPNPVNPGIENIEAIENNAIYTITGKRVQGILEKGLYIVNGKKVLVK